jgi:DNA-binding LacI/PurR family transcriptional regulator
MAESGVAAVRELMQRRERPDAIIAANAKVARGVLDELVALGFAIPDDVAVAAIDDPFPAGRFGPCLTVVEQPGYAMGQASSSWHACPRTFPRSRRGRSSSMPRCASASPAANC